MRQLMTNEIIEQFSTWFFEAKAMIPYNADAAALATATKAGKPSVRFILLKAFDAHGFVFYTNFNSKKAQQLLENPEAALCFYWPSLDKQIRIEGKVEKVSIKEADEYFVSRERGSKIAAWASNQSHPLTALSDLKEQYESYEQQFKDKEVPRPDYWSGFRLMPNLIEFWKSGAYRMHERLCYIRNENGEWQKNYLYP